MKTTDLDFSSTDGNGFVWRTWSASNFDVFGDQKSLLNLCMHGMPKNPRGNGPFEYVDSPLCPKTVRELQTWGLVHKHPPMCTHASVHGG